MQLSTACRNAALDAIETTIGTFPTLKLFSGSPPSNCAAADSGSLRASFVMGSNWAQAASEGSKDFVTVGGVVTAAFARGSIGHYRLYDSSGVCHMQGTVTAPGGGGDMILTEATVTTPRQLNIMSWVVTDNNG